LDRIESVTDRGMFSVETNMRIVHLTPGTGSFHCGSCLRDNALIKALRDRGHDAVMCPLYLPLVTDDEPANPELEVQVGGINLYLRQCFPRIVGLLPAPVRRFLNAPKRLRSASRRIGMTSARDLGEMTRGSLQGPDGNQAPDWQGLVNWLAESEDGVPDVVSLSNSLLAGLVPMIRARLGNNFPIVISLQGEDGFLDALDEPYRSECWELLSAHASETTAIVAPSRYYAAEMEQRFGLNSGTIHVVPNGFDWERYNQAGKGVERAEDPPEILYLARLIHDKGLNQMVEGFLQLRKNATSESVTSRTRLHLAGAYCDSDRPNIDELKSKIDQAGLTKDVRWSPNVSFEEKVRALKSATLFSIPAPSEYGEAFGLPIIEAMACGTPVIQPDHGAYPEIINATGGGLIHQVDHPADLAEKINRLLEDKATRSQLATSGRKAVAERYSAAAMAESFEAVLDSTQS